MSALALTVMSLVAFPSLIWAKTPSPCTWPPTPETPIAPPWTTVIEPSWAEAWMPSLAPEPPIVPPLAVVMAMSPRPVALAWMPSFGPEPPMVMAPEMPPPLAPMVMSPLTAVAWMPSPPVALMAPEASMATVAAPAVFVSASPSMPSP